MDGDGFSTNSRPKVTQVSRDVHDKDVADRRRSESQNEDVKDCER